MSGNPWAGRSQQKDVAHFGRASRRPPPQTPLRRTSHPRRRENGRGPCMIAESTVEESTLGRRRNPYAPKTAFSSSESCASTASRPTSRRKPRRPSWSKPKCSAPIGRRNRVQFPVTGNFTITTKHLTIVPRMPRYTMELITMSDLHKLESTRVRQRAKYLLLPRKAEVPNEPNSAAPSRQPIEAPIGGGRRPQALRFEELRSKLGSFRQTCRRGRLARDVERNGFVPCRSPIPPANCILPANMVISIGNRRLLC